MGNIASRFKWVFGTDPDRLAGAGTPGPAQNVTGSTGALAVNTHNWGENFTFLIENTDSNMAYQIRIGRTSSGPWAVLSSGSMTSTSQVDAVQLPGPLGWVSPRVDAMASTVNSVIIRMTGIES